jgi:hypothetical protein
MILCTQMRNISHIHDISYHHPNSCSKLLEAAKPLDEEERLLYFAKTKTPERTLRTLAGNLLVSVMLSCNTSFKQQVSYACMYFFCSFFSFHNHATLTLNYLYFCSHCPCSGRAEGQSCPILTNACITRGLHQPIRCPGRALFSVHQTEAAGQEGVRDWNASGHRGNHVCINLCVICSHLVTIYTLTYMLYRIFAGRSTGPEEGFEVGEA